MFNCDRTWPQKHDQSLKFFSLKLFLALISPAMKYLTPVKAVILEGVRGVDWFPVSLAPISVSRGKKHFYKCCWQYTKLNKVLSHLISHINLDEVIEAVAFDFDCTSYTMHRTPFSIEILFTTFPLSQKEGVIHCPFKI